jgi:alkylation response protein AidB-like acyl-CoA dehydrogenase
VDFSLNEQQQHLQSTARSFATKELTALADHLEEVDESVSASWMKRFGELGFLGINVPEAFGGHGLSHFDAVLVLEEFARISPAVAMPVFEANFGPMAVLVHFAPEPLRRRVVPRVCAGELIVAVTMSEPDAGSALTDLRTKGELNGSKVVLNGAKRWCSGAGHADGYVVYCRMADRPGAAGIGAVYVEKGTPGLTFGERERLMGFRGITSADMFFDNVTVPAENVIVPAGGFKHLMEAFDLERCGNTTMCVGLAAGALDYVTRYVQERRQFGKPIVDFQAVQLKLAEMTIKVESARLMLYRAVCNADRGLPSILDASLAKCCANEMVREVTGSALQLMGGYGYSKEYPMERRLRDAWGWGIAGGTIDIQKINIASAVIGRRFDQRR